MSKDTNADKFAGYEEVKPQNVSFNVVGDYIKGTIVDIMPPTTPDQFGNLKYIYSIRADEGEMHLSQNRTVDKDATKVNEGDIWRYYVLKDSVLEKNMRLLKKGQKVGIVFVETKPTKKGNDAKIIKVYAGPMDGEWLSDNGQAEAGSDDDF